VVELVGSRQSSAPVRPGRGAGGAQGAHSAALLKDCQQAVVTLFAAPPGTRRGPTRTTKTHQTASRAPPPRALRTRTASRHPSPGVRRRTISPTSVNWPFPPREERGSGLIPNCAGHQAVDYRRGAPRRRSLKPGRRPRQPATSRQGARRGAHRRPPHPRPTTTDSTVTLGSRTRPASELIMRIHCGRLAPPLGLAGGKDTAAVPWRPPRINDIPNLVTNPVVCLGAERLRVRSAAYTPSGALALWAYSL
jgi:hypothetical protein